jgi:D-beta-D-heptose 7-phosphate kinase/D-beta-D-heptose 1-phosphate adenosyltransferase
VLVKGGDWPLASIVGREIVEADGGEVHSLPFLPGDSTTELLERIRQL